MSGNVASEHTRLMAGRPAGIMERRCIVRQDVGHQRTLIVGAVYASDTANHVLDISHGHNQILRALGHCVKNHPILSAVILDGHTEHPNFAMLETLDLSQHIDARDFDGRLSEHVHIERLLAKVSDEQFPSVDQFPPWKVVLVPLPAQHGAAARLLVLFAYYHSHGDGKAGLAFHRTFFEGLNDAVASDAVKSETTSYLCEASAKKLPPPMEEAGKLSVSWSYLLSPLLGEYLPSFFATLFGVRASAVAQDEEIWCGKPLGFDLDNFRTGVAMITIDDKLIQAALKHCRTKRVSFTGLLNHLIARAISGALGQDHSTKAFASQIVVDLRHLSSDTYDDNSMVNCVSAYNETILNPSLAQQSDWTSPTNEIWSAARSTTAGLVKCAGTLHNQPVGLLQYLKDFRPWTLGQIGKKRDSSFEISNLVVFDPDLPPGELAGSTSKSARIERTIFAQPANAAGACLDFNLVTTKSGPLVMTVTWQLGVLDVGDLEQEASFVRDICARFEQSINELVKARM